jgi:hypothetical protein
MEAVDITAEIKGEEAFEKMMAGMDGCGFTPEERVRFMKMVTMNVANFFLFTDESPADVMAEAVSDIDQIMDSNVTSMLHRMESLQ